MLDLLLVFAMHGGLVTVSPTGACLSISVEWPDVAATVCPRLGIATLRVNRYDWWEHTWNAAWYPR